MNKKRFWHIVCIVIVSISIPPILFCMWGMYKAFYMSGVESHDIEDYVSGRYLRFPGGNDIDGCIPTLEELGDYESLSFGYFDGRRKSFLSRKYHISFGLRVEYNEEEYLKRKRQSGLRTNNYDDETGAIEGYKFVETDSLTHVLYGALYNDRLNTIKYVAICVDNGSAMVDNGDIKIKGELWFLLTWNDPF